MIKKIKNYRRDIIIFLLVYLVAVIMCSAFLRPHYAHETYKIIHMGYTEYSFEYFLKEGRIFTAIITRFADIINLPIEIYIVVSFLLALVFLSISVVSVYNIFRKEIKNNSKWIDVILVLICFLIIFNYFAIEYIFFLECFIMAFAILLSVIIAKIIINNERYRYIKTFLLGLIVVFCYQGALAIFPMLVLVYKLIIEKSDFKNLVKDIIKISVIYVVLMLLTILYSKFIFGGSRVQMMAEPFSITDVLKWTYDLVFNSLGVILPFLHVGIVALILLLIIFFTKSTKKETMILILKYLFIIIYSIGMSLAPIIGGSGLELTPRTCIAYACTIGLSLFILLYLINDNKKKYQIVVLSIIIIFTFIYTASIYVILTNQHLEVNKLDKENCEKIKEAIERYEEETNIKVTKIAAIRREDSIEYYPGFIHAGTITRRALNTWPLRETIIYYTGRELGFIVYPMEKYYERYRGKHYDDFSMDLVLIEGDTLYYYGG